MTEIIVKNNQTIQPNNPYESDSWFCPANLTGHFIASAKLPIADFQDPALTFDVKTFRSDDNVNWDTYNTGNFQGGPQVDRGGSLISSFSIGFDAADIAGKYVKVQIEVNQKVKAEMVIITE